VPARVAVAPVAAAAVEVRASDAERDAVVERLSAACAEGRLTLEELGGRVGVAYAALWRADLEALLADLPPAPSPAGAADRPPVEVPRRKWLVAVMGSVVRRGHWRLPPRTNVVAVMSSSELDLRSALIESNDIEIRVWSLMSEQRVVVPDGVEVEVSGLELLGERKVEVNSAAPRPGVPRLHVKVVGVMSGLTVTNGAPSGAAAAVPPGVPAALPAPGEHDPR